MTRLIAGGYAEAGAQGLYRLTVDGETLAAEGPVAPVLNVSGGCRIPDTRRWLLVDETAGRIVLVDGAADWRVIAAVAAGGDGPCHLALDPSGRMLAVAHYDSGSVALFRLDPATGAPIEPPSVHRHAGHGPVPDRQQGPHAHWVGFDRAGRLYATDLGADRVLVFDAADAAAGTLGTPPTAYVAPPGSGPRHLAFHPAAPVAFLISELASTLTVLAIADDGMFSARRILSTLPAGARRASLGGAITLDAARARLYVSNRGHDSIASFAIDASGDAAPLGHVGCGGRSPRFLLLADEGLLVAHEQADGVTLLPIGDDGSTLLPVARADLPGAAFLGVLPT